MPPDELEISPDTRTTEDLDKLADQSEIARNSERAMNAPKENKAPAAKEESFEFEHGGKKVKGTRDQIIKWAQMGYDRPQAMQKFNQEKQAWENQKKQWESQWEVYKQIDDFAKSNSDWWKYVESNWQNRTNFQPGQPAPGAPAHPPQIDPRLQSFERELSEIKPVVSEIKTALQTWQETREDQELDSEIQSIRGQHKDLDWESLDENGKSLETRVLEHAQQNGIRTFKTAFRDLLHDELLNRAEASAKLAVSKGIQQRTKLGVLGQSPTSKTQAPQRTKDIRKTSYEELEDEIRQELRAATR